VFGYEEGRCCGVWVSRQLMTCWKRRCSLRTASGPFTACGRRGQRCEQAAAGPDERSPQVRTGIVCFFVHLPSLHSSWRGQAG
jgi:hypothetical protein